MLLDWLHNGTDVDEAPDQRGGEIDEAQTWNSLRPTPESRGTVAERPKASRYRMVVDGISDVYRDIKLCGKFSSIKLLGY